jgi:glycosyltransferase involved in cell wall biosynthesis
MSSKKKHHVIITGTGRSGTTFLVKLLTYLGLDTGFTSDYLPQKGYRRSYSIYENSKGGLEHQGLGGNLPYIIKNPKLMWQLPELLKNSSVVIDHIILPMRDIHAASESRRVNVRNASEIEDPRTVPGGLEGVTDPQKQEEFFLEKYYEFSHFISTYNIPVTLLQYPRIVSDRDYLFNKLCRVFKGIDKNEFDNAFNNILEPSLVHKYNSNDAYLTNIYDDSHNISVESSSNYVENIELKDMRNRLIQAENTLMDILEFRKPREVYAELFYKVDNQYSQENSIGKYVKVTDEAITFEFIEPKEIDSLRFDPCEEESVICVNSVVFQANGKKYKVNLESSNCDYMQKNSGDLLYFLKTDPQIFFNFSGTVESVTFYISYLAIGKTESYALSLPLIMKDYNTIKVKDEELIQTDKKQKVTENQLNILNTELARTRGQLDKKNIEIIDMVKDNNQLVQKHINLMDTQNQLIKGIRQELVKIEEQVQQIKELNRLLAEKEAHIEEQRKVILHKEETIEGKLKEREELDILITERNEYINLIYSTLSWRITKPLRLIRRALKVIKENTKKVIKKLAKETYYFIPLPRKYKVLLKNGFYKHTKFFMKNTEMYKLWEVSFNTSYGEDLEKEADKSCNKGVIKKDEAQSISHIYQDIIEEHGAISMHHKNLTESNYNLSDNDIKLIAFYLPQFHPIKENDEWWGKGFTEWTNVSKALPQFKGHYQPHLPGELNFYDLRIPEVMERQVDLAKTYGIYGFCFHYYWFDGRRILDKPVDQFIESNIEFPFCLCWANENWTRSWDGEENEILLEQNYKNDDLKQFIVDIEKYFADSRYIRIDNKPLLIIYRPSLIPNLKKIVSGWRAYCKENGIEDIYILGVYVKSWGYSNHKKYGLDGMLEFPPHSMYESGATIMNDKVSKVNKNFNGLVFDYKEYVENEKYFSANVKELYKGISPSWDNTPRRGDAATIYHGSTPELYKKWLIDIINHTKRVFTKEKQIVFLNAWNEWAEGAHLEPDRKYGYAYLEATREAIIETSKKKKNRKILVVGHDAFQHGAQILLLNIVKYLNKRFKYKVYVVLKNSGELLDEFKKVSKVYILNNGDSDKEIKHIIQKIKNEGVEHAIANTVITGNIVRIIKEENMKVVSLVHELSGVIKQYRAINNVKDILTYSDKIIFPSEFVKKDIETMVTVNKDKVIVCPQGLFFKNQYNNNYDEAKKILRKEMNLPKNSKIVLGIGYADKRKGIDIFINIANKFESEKELFFIWIGKKDISFWEKNNLEEKIEKTKNIILLDYQQDLSLYYSGSDIFLLTSREDPFPNVVIDALDAGLPVVGFENAGGFSDIVHNDTGRLVPYLDLEIMEQSCRELIYNDKLRKQLGDNGKKEITKKFLFKDYVYKILDFLEINEKKVSVVIPNYNYARYLTERIKSVIKQDYPIYEIIILDDHSTDNSRNIICDLVKHYGDITDFIFDANEKNSGNVFSQWYKGVDMVSGDYIWIAEADDLSEDNFLTTVIKGFNDNVILSYCQSKQIGSKGEYLAEDYKYYTNDISKEKWMKNYINNGINEIQEILVIKNTIPNVSAVIFKNTEVLKRSIQEAAKYKVAGDWYVYVCILSKGDLAYFTESLNNHRRHDKGVTISDKAINIYNEIVNMQNYIISKYNISSNILVKVQKYEEELREQLLKK